jgi:serine phosphatase RsbU (regulator of sigma subunit)
VLDIELATGGDPAQFRRYMSSYTSTGGLFVSASLWRTDGPSPAPVISVGGAPVLAPASSTAKAFIARATRIPSFTVTSILADGAQRIGYALADVNHPTYVVYAERAIPANRQVAVERNSAFADLNYATYLGSTTNLATLETTDVPLNRLPLSGDTARASIPFGDTTLTLVTAPIGHLGGSLGAQLPWIFLVGGIVLTSAAAPIAGQLVRRRTAAERDSQTISGLYERLDVLYGEQRAIAETLQHALLPPRNPSIPALELASRYVAGVRGVDIGGDWYSVTLIDDDHVAFVVGDVSGRGVEAAAIMARIRYTLGAYLLEGHAPDVALGMCSRQVDITTDGHIATVLVGIAELASRTITLASAGHLSPLMVTATGSSYLSTTVGLPLGVAPTSYRLSTFTMPPGSSLLAFTDGLVERRDEDLDLGLQRLAGAITDVHGPLEDVLTALLSRMIGDGSEDDIAILAFRWLTS